MKKDKTSCVEPARGPIASAQAGGDSEINQKPQEEKKTMGVMVGKAAPDFEAVAYHEGTFKPIKLSSYKGQWVVLCFYPGDFTFV